MSPTIDAHSPQEGNGRQLSQGRLTCFRAVRIGLADLDDAAPPGSTARPPSGVVDREGQTGVLAFVTELTIFSAEMARALCDVAGYDVETWLQECELNELIAGPRSAEGTA